MAFVLNWLARPELATSTRKPNNKDNTLRLWSAGGGQNLRRQIQLWRIAALFRGRDCSILDLLINKTAVSLSRLTHGLQANHESAGFFMPDPIGNDLGNSCPRNRSNGSTRTCPPETCRLHCQAPRLKFSLRNCP